MSPPTREGPSADGGVADDLRAILDYLGLAPDDPEMVLITGLPPADLDRVLQGSGDVPERIRHHIGITAAIVRVLAAGREAATGSRHRPASARDWLHTGQVLTSRGLLAPIDVLSDTALAEEALDEMQR